MAAHASDMGDWHLVLLVLLAETAAAILSACLEPAAGL